MKIEFSFQRRERLLFLTTNMASVTSRANQQWVSVKVSVTLLFRNCKSLYLEKKGLKKVIGVRQSLGLDFDFLPQYFNLCLFVNEANEETES